jgi:two-component system, NtrC family, sensor kinase
MTRRPKASDVPVKTPNRKMRKRGSAAKAVGRRGSSAVSPETSLALLARERDDALERLSAASEILKVISSSPEDLKPVFDAILEKATSICEANFGILNLFEDGAFRIGAMHNAPHAFIEARLREPLQRLSPSRPLARAVATKQPVNVVDYAEELSYKERDPGAVRLFELSRPRSLVVVPMLKSNEPIGVITIYRLEVKPFTDKQIALLQNFADQAVIAIENARLFNEVQAKTRDLSEALTYQTGSSNILRVIASSPTDVAPVLKAIVESACELCDAKDAIVHLRDGDNLRPGAHYGPIPSVLEKWTINRNWVTGRSVIDKVPIHVLDMLSPEGDEFPETRERARRTGTRTYLSVPLLRDGRSIGAIVLRRTEVHPFSDKQIALLQTFADQAVIAIGNVRLFEEVQTRTRELSQSLDDLRAAQDRLVQTEKLASLGQLTAGIAHEIKNPLNFVNNFSALSAELVAEMSDVLAKTSLDTTTRKELDELAQMLKSNLEKVVQHGKRADSIVKNMLLHSREGSGEHRSADINALVEESLNLAYHGARAEKPGFNVTLMRNLDPDAGAVELYPQEITRTFLNLISNGFYAATKRKMENGDPNFEPVLSAATKNLGNHVEIRIRDNGTGIPTEVKEKIFNPFFTTKPAGEGTGLGLSMSHDIIVKQHGGRIEVDTQPGQFTEFRIVLPRAGASLIKSGEQR